MAVPRSDRFSTTRMSVAITRQVKPGQVEAFEAWLEETQSRGVRDFTDTLGWTL